MRYPSTTNQTNPGDASLQDIFIGCCSSADFRDRNLKESKNHTANEGNIFNHLVSSDVIYSAEGG
jgi:hypothetical protein